MSEYRTPEVYQKMQDEFIEEGLAFRIVIPTQEEIDKNIEDGLKDQKPYVYNYNAPSPNWHQPYYDRQEELDDWNYVI